MKNARYFVSVLLVFLSINALTIYSAQAQLNSCSLPYDLKPWDYYAAKYIRSGGDWKNNTNTDYWQLVYSWSPNFCASQGKRVTNSYQCRKAFGLIVHGLWAQSANAKNIRQHPRNCQDTPALNKQILKEHFCLMPDVQLMQKEWEKHGTCDFKKPQDYFATIKHLDAQLNLPDKKTMQSMQHAKEAVIQSWLLKNNKKINLKAEHIIFSKRKNNLKEIAFCFDTNFELRSCRSKAKAPFKKPAVKFSQTQSALNALAKNTPNKETLNENTTWKEQLFMWFGK